MWEWATPDSAESLTKRLKDMGLLNRAFGSFDSTRLLVHKSAENSIDGCLYCVPDSLYATISEVWVFRPGAMLNFRGATELFRERYPEATQFVGYIDSTKTRYINALLKKGATYEGLKMQVNWHE